MLLGNLPCYAVAPRSFGGASALRLPVLAVLVLLGLAGARPALAQPSASGAAAGIEAFGANSIAFDGSDGRVTISSSALTMLPSSFTIEFWARRGQNGRSNDLAFYHGASQSLNNLLHIGFRDNNVFTAGFYGNDLNTPAYPDLGWHHWAFSYNGTTRARKIYRDGALVAEDVSAAAYTGTGPIRFGSLSGFGAFAGSLDEVRIWNSARTAQQVRDSRNAVLPATSTGLVGYWDFEALANLGAGTAGTNDVADRSFNAAHGDVAGGATLALASYAAPAVRATYDLYEDRVVLAWDRTASATARYQIRRDGLLLTTLSATDTTYTDLAGVAGRAYPYCVTRQDGTTLTDLGCDDGRRQLLAPTNVAATDATFNDKVRLTWSDRSTINTGYRVYRAGTLIATLGDAGTFDDTTKAALTPGTAYTFCVAPIQGAGEGLQVCDTGSRGSVLPVLNLRASDGQQILSTLVTWADQGTGTTGFVVTRGGTTLATLGAGVTQYRDVTGVAGTTYPYCVVRQQGAGSAVPVCDAGSHGTLAAPTAVAASDSTRDDRVDVRWTPPGGAESGYRVYRQGGYGLTFDGVNDRIEVPAFTQSPSAVTVEAWVRSEGAFIDLGGIATKGVNGTPWSLTVRADGRLHLFVNYNATGGTAAAEYASTGLLALNAWQHVAATVGGGFVRFYINGVLAGETAAAVTFGANAEPLMIGAELPGADEYFRGRLDEVRVWSTVRTQAEIRAGMFAAATGAEDGLAALFHLDEGAGTLATDARGGKHGVLSGFNGTSTSGWATVAAPIAGHHLRPALALDGTDDHATVPGLTALPASFTIEFWAKRGAIGRSDFAVGQGLSATNQGLNVGFRGNNRFILSFLNNDLDTPVAFTDLDWHHWAVTYDRTTGRRAILRDGVEVASDVTTGAYAGSGALQIGRSAAGGNGTFGGLLSEVRVWSRVRSAGSIAANRFALADTARAGLVGAWAFDALDPAGTAAMTNVSGGTASMAVLANGAALTAGRPSLLATLAAGASTAADTGAEPGMRYTYCVTSFATEGAETAGACDVGQRARTVAPVIVVASDGTHEDRVAVAWQGASTRAATYNVYRDGTLIATLPASRSTYEDRTGAPTTVYTYCLAAFTSDGSESARACDGGHRLLRTPAVTAADDAQEDRLDVSWTDNSGAETGYRVSRRPATPYALALPAIASDTRIPHSPVHDITVGGFTVEFWIKPTGLSGDRKLLIKDGGSHVNGEFMIGFAGNVLYPEVFDVGGRQSASAGNVPNGVWSHVAVTYKAGGALVLYVNGVEVGRDATVGATIAPNTQPFRFSGIGTNVQAEIDELRFWNGVRSGAQIAAFKDRLVTPGEAGLVGLWSFDEGRGALAADASGFRNHAIVGGATWAARTASVPASVVLTETAAGVTTYTDRTAASGVHYVYEVTPFDAAGTGGSAEDVGRRLLAAPTELSVISAANETQVTLDWKDNSRAETVQRIVRTSGTETSVFSAAPNTFRFTDLSPAVGTLYRYSLVAEDAVGVSEASASVQGGAVLLPPASVSASDSYYTNVVVTWVDASAIETGYVILRDGTQIGTVGAGVTAYTDAGGTAGVTYIYTVRTANGDLRSADATDTGLRLGGDTVPSTPSPGLVLPTQILPNINMANLGFGAAVAVSGNYAIVGQAGKNSGSGGVVFFERTANEWVRKTDFSSAECITASSGQGGVVAIGGDWAATRCINQFNNGLSGIDYREVVIVFQRTSTGWVQSSVLIEPEADMSFGTSIALDGDYMLIGTASNGDLSRAHRVYTYKRGGTTWGRTNNTLIKPDPQTSNEGFGRRIVMDGARAVIGGESLTSNNGGNAFVYERTGDTWTRSATLSTPTGSQTGSFGGQIALNGDYVLASGYDGTNPAAYLYQKVGTTWTYRRKMRPAVRSANTNYFAGHIGGSIALVDDFALIGGSGSAVDGARIGTVYLYERTNDEYGRCGGGECVETRRYTPRTNGTETLGAAANDEGFIAHNGGSAGGLFPYSLTSAAGGVEASDGTYAARVQVTWSTAGTYTQGYRVYRNGQLIGEVGASTFALDDFDAPTGDVVRYCVSSFQTVSGESPPECDLGWRPANGVVAGRLATQSTGQAGAGVAGANVCLAPSPNQAVLLDGTGGSVVTTSAVDLSGSELTIEYWYRGTSLPTVRQDRSGLGHIGAGTGGEHEVWNGTGQSKLTMGTGINDGRWHHVAMTWKQNTADGFRAYLDGVLVASKASSAQPLFNLDTPLAIGSSNGEGGFTRGQYDEVRVWKRVRTHTELQAGMYTPLTGSEAGLFLYFPLDQGEGGYALNRAPGNVHGTLVGGASWTTEAAPMQSCAVSDAAGAFTISGIRYGSGKTFTVTPTLPATAANTALLFNNTTNAVKLASVRPAGDELTVSYWFRGSSLQSAVRQQDGEGYFIAGWGGKHGLSNDGGVDAGIPVGAAATDGNWHHVAMTWKKGATNGFVSYLDGELIAQRTASTNPIPNVTGDLYIGSYIGTSEFSNGQIDDVRIWKRALTQTQLRAEMTANPSPENLIVHLPFNEGAGATTRNAAVFGVNATISGGATWSTRTPAGTAHLFQPVTQTVSLNAASPIQNQVTFTDVSTYTVAGRARVNTTSPKTGLSYGTCGLPDATISSPDVASVTTDLSGEYRIALMPGMRTITISRSGLTFTPNQRAFDLTSDLTGQDFVAGPLRRFIVNTETAGGFSIGTVTLRIRSEDGCYDREAVTDANGVFSDDLPPLRYTVEAYNPVLKPNTGLDLVDVARYYTGLGAQTMDLTEKADTLSMAYHAPLKIAVTGLPRVQDQSCVAPDKLGVPTLAQGLFYPLFVSVTEDFGALGSFPAQNLRLQIFDEIADESGTPIDTTLTSGLIAYQTNVGQPNVLAGRVVDGVDRSYQKSLQIVATAGSRTATRTDWAVVTGQKARNGSFVSFTTEEVPLYVLRDPPGDASYSYIEKGANYCYTLADWSTSNQLGFVSNFQNMIGAHNLFLTAPLGVGTAVDLQVGVGVQGGTDVSMTWRREGNTQLCLEAKERFSTSASPEFVGAEGDVFIGAAFNMLFAQTDVIKVNGGTCEIVPSTAFGVAPDPTNPVRNTYAYTTKHIRDVLIPQIEALRVNAAPTDTTRYGTYLANWRNHLAYNEALKVPHFPNEASDQRSFSGGADFAASFTSDTTHYHAWSTHMYNNSGLGVHQALKIPGLEFNAGWQLKFTRETTFELPGFIGAPPFNGRQSYSGRRTTGYVLSDRHTGDQYAVNVRPEDPREVKVYIPTASTEAASIGYGAVSGILSAAGGAATIASVYSGLSAYYAGRGALNGSITGALIGTGVNLAFGLAQGLYDLSALLDPQNVTSASVQTKLRAPFGSPVFDLVSGSSSCPWLPDSVYAGGTTRQKGTLRRDLPTLAINKNALVNADPSKAAVFSLFLGNASESNETRRYVLRSINERNPNGAILKVNGTPIHEGVVFTLLPGRQIEATLTVERGPTRFRYDSLQVILYPECEGLPARISEKEGAVQTFSVTFKSVSSPVTLYTSSQFDLDFGALAETAPGDSVALADFTLETIDYGLPGTADDDVYLTEIGMQYRPAGSAVWETAFAATRAQIVAASPQGAGATTFYTRWKPRTADADGAYAFRAYTRSTGGGPAGAFFYAETLPGRIDRKAPLVYGTPQPADEVLGLGDDLAITFDEALAPASVLADSSAGVLAAANLRLAYADGAEAGQRIRVRAVVSGAGVVITPVAGWAALEGRRLTAEVRVGSGARPLTDLLGNAFAATRTWAFTVRRSVFAWSAPTVSAAVTRGVAPRFTVNLANGRTDAVAFTLDGVPAWLTPSLRAGTIAPGAVQPITFVGADTLSGGTRTATMQATIAGGTLPLSVNVTVDATPSWSVTPSQFQHTMSVTAQLFLKGRPSVDANDVVGAFVNGELRGVAHVAPRTSTGLSAPDSNRVALVVYANAASGELVTFKVWDADATAPTLYSFTSRTLAFQPDAIAGTPARPLSINAPYVPGAASVALNAGWTWVSFNRVPQGAKLADVLAPVYGVNPFAGDVVKGQRAFAMFAGSGATGAWVGPLADTLVDPRQAYLVRLSASQELTLGAPTVAADTSSALPLAAGWSWIGFPRRVRQPLGHALAAGSFSPAPAADDLIKSQTAFAQYVPGTGWVGSLTELEPGKGYLIKRASVGSLTYPASPPPSAAQIGDLDVPTASADAGAQNADAVDVEAVAQAALAASGWAVNPSAFAFNMTAIAVLDDPSVAPGALVGAFVGDTCRGVVPLRFVAGSTRPVAFLMAYANRAVGETLTLRLYDPASGTTRTLAPAQPFTADAVMGTLAAPLVLRTGAATAAEAEALPEAFAVLAPAPNPFTARSTLRYALPNAEHVTVDVYDVTGRRVLRLVDETQAPGRYAVTIDGQTLASGVYVVHVRAGSFAHTSRLMRLR